MIKPFPDTVLTPSSAHRLPDSLGCELVGQLVEHGVNAAGFLMDDDLLVDLAKNERRPFHNDPERAFADLKAQLPDAVREAFWPTPRPLLVEIVEYLSDGSGGGNDEENDDGSSMRDGIKMPLPGADGGYARRKRRDEEEEQQQRRGRGISL